MDDNLKRIGLRIKEARRERKISQAELAEKLEISISHMSEIENGKTSFSIDIFMRMTEILQVSADMLLRTNVPEVDVIYADEFRELMKDCSSDEKEAMLQMLRNMKSVFVKNRNKYVHSTIIPTSSF